ncbi:MAG: hypothetical protein AB4372_30660 [Xenococcus sp. (in: cyanobacteria)]
MDINLLNKFEREALQVSIGFGYSDEDKFEYHPKVKAYYHFPKEEDDSLTILVIEMIPDLVGYWDCWDVTSIDDCPYLSKEIPHFIFEEKPNCEHQRFCLAEERESFVIVYEISQTEFERINHHHIGDFEREYVDTKKDSLENYEISKQDIVKLNLPEFCSFL